jgi:hypothetical protein
LIDPKTHRRPGRRMVKKIGGLCGGGVGGKRKKDRIEILSLGFIIEIFVMGGQSRKTFDFGYRFVSRAPPARDKPWERTKGMRRNLPRKKWQRYLTRRRCW